uniref:uncharacterized protein LOC122597636 n=1 Tax=Erigeron canadensis TaxID=72917 RepID=UPI001CB9D190|nr:uncharacterized protein LOC122597636 [Erigeron canadensis]
MKPIKSSQTLFISSRFHNDEDDFQTPSQSLPLTRKIPVSSHPIKSTVTRPSKKPKKTHIYPGKENLENPSSDLGLESIKPTAFCDVDEGVPVICKESNGNPLSSLGLKSIKPTDFRDVGDGVSFMGEEILEDPPSDLGLDSIKPTVFCDFDDRVLDTGKETLETPSSDLGLQSIKPTAFSVVDDGVLDMGIDKKVESKRGFGYLSNSIESRLLRSKADCSSGVCENACEKVNGDGDEEFEDDQEGGTTQLDLLLDLCCSDKEEEEGSEAGDDVDVGFISCPICEADISNLSDGLRQAHTNECLDKEQANDHVEIHDSEHVMASPGHVFDDRPIGAPEQVLGDSSCQALGQIHDVSPISAWLQKLGLSRYEEVFIREEIDWDSLKWLTDEDLCKIGITALGPRKKIVHALSELRTEDSEEAILPEKYSEKEIKVAPNKLITDFFPGFTGKLKKGCITGAQVGKTNSNNNKRKVNTNFTNKRHRDIPSWCSIAGTPFRVDAFKYLRMDCSHWFLTHFHADHYGGLTKSFCHGKIYCTLITAKLVNFKIGIPWEKIEILPLNQKITIAGVDVTCFDANHCPGAVIILFEPPNGKTILHTGDFRFSEDMTKISSLQMRVHTLILDTTYCNPQYDFPKQEAVIQYVLEAIQAEAFNPRTLFLIGSYTIGKERVFMEVARVLRKKIYVTAAKMRVLECLGMPREDMQWLTTDERESHIHVVPMWTLASFKRLKHVSNMYMGRYSLIVAFSPTGWSFGKGKKSSPGKRWQQGTIIRYEVPYSEHSSFTELKEFVKFVSPEYIIPSVNNHSRENANKMISLISS